LWRLDFRPSGVKVSLYWVGGRNLGDLEGRGIWFAQVWITFQATYLFIASTVSSGGGSFPGWAMPLGFWESWLEVEFFWGVCGDLILALRTD
jgi:hypothetical protein